ncbi:ParB/RepB/Spo0J family partition protein [Burkholderia gladioli]|uniref:Chromosome partitioning protein ParB n=1 Tax=Burkholderia gladioli TaxID=28095 RepID=A0A2A7SAH5_BURGA|nr:ParB/RepB/Spo0J family partition protein [Burkholderia gladioli]AYQ86021.1 ParB/RepB/Spo0J family partition protein [Burkholderia gladioli]MBJ9711949.1 ParB/RepB/Spo0J family partition protein [Burkholderia gladioli]MCH7273572.1 ParB/RepB/Spo0J family partition protein [Burkholderia gladioli]MDZ4041556.1 ParB/RepB/Spo0J family partition protein [Burkholderia gladioli pv. alliicola]PEH40538.1 chromosome partitioning protein ParB [Burkholderia gladioli]
MAKNFGDQLRKGQARDDAMRSEKVTDRFARAETALEGRESLLSEHRANPETNRSDPNFYVETLERAGKVKAVTTTWAIDMVEDNPLNSRRIYDEAIVKARANSIAKDGQMLPALAARHPSDPKKLILIDGQYRKRARIFLKHAELDVKILDGLEPIDFWRLARTANSEREQESALDAAYAFRRLLDEGYAPDQERLAALVGESKGVVNKHLALLDLPEPALDLMAANPALFGINMAYEITLYRKAVQNDDRTLQLIQRVIAEQLSFRKVEAIRKALQKGPRQRNPTARQFKYTRPDGTSIGTIKEWDDGRIQVDLNLGDQVERFREALQEMLAADGAKAD